MYACYISRVEKKPHDQWPKINKVTGVKKNLLRRVIALLVTGRAHLVHP